MSLLPHTTILEAASDDTSIRLSVHIYQEGRGAVLSLLLNYNSTAMNKFSRLFMLQLWLATIWGRFLVLLGLIPATNRTIEIFSQPCATSKGIIQKLSSSGFTIHLEKCESSSKAPIRVGIWNISANPNEIEELATIGTKLDIILSIVEPENGASCYPIRSRTGEWRLQVARDGRDGYAPVLDLVRSGELEKDRASKLFSVWKYVF